MLGKYTITDAGKVNMLNAMLASLTSPQLRVSLFTNQAWVDDDNNLGDFTEVQGSNWSTYATALVNLPSVISADSYQGISGNKATLLGIAATFAAPLMSDGSQQIYGAFCTIASTGGGGDFWVGGSNVWDDSANNPSVLPSGLLVAVGQPVAVVFNLRLWDYFQPTPGS
jgi:hypothetical protein